MQAVAMMMLLLWAGYEDLAVFGSHLAQDRLVVTLCLLFGAKFYLGISNLL
jgi:hypothetical protein